MRPYRKERIANVIRDIVSDAIARKLNDPRLEPLTTITRVEMTGDLLIAKIFLSIPGGSAAEKRTLTAVQHAAKYVQRLVAREMRARHCPELRFAVDESRKIALNTMELLMENQKERGILEAEEALEPADPAIDSDRITCNEDNVFDDQHHDASDET